jgi:predicted TIM-barrel fold metal-dependent hydrolase
MHHVPLTDRRVERIVEAVAAQPGTGVFVHCGVLSVGVRKKLGLPSRFDLSLGDPLSMARLALAYPGVPFIVPHFGAGMLRETMMAADACPNVYVDTSSSNSWTRYAPGWTLSGVFKTAMSVLGPSRILFGTDSSFFPRGWQRGVYDSQTAAAAEIGITESDQALIFGGNFERLFPVRPQPRSR